MMYSIKVTCLNEHVYKVEVIYGDTDLNKVNDHRWYYVTSPVASVEHFYNVKIGEWQARTPYGFFWNYHRKDRKQYDGPFENHDLAIRSCLDLIARELNHV